MFLILQGVGTPPNPFPKSSSICKVGGEDELSVLIAQLRRKVEAMEMSQLRGPPKMIDEPCIICEGSEHVTKECPIILFLKTLAHEQANALGAFRQTSYIPHDLHPF